MVSVVTPSNFEGSKKEILESFTRHMTFKELIEYQNDHTDTLIHITLETLYDMQAVIEFIPLIY